MLSLNPVRTMICAFAIVLCSGVVHAQARLTIENSSQRELTVKVMQVASGVESLHEQISIPAFGRQTVTFTSTGDYFTKTMAAIGGTEPVYQKGQPFRVYNGTDGYSVITLKFSIIESAAPQLTGGAQISKKEFDKNEEH